MAITGTEVDDIGQHKKVTVAAGITGDDIKIVTAPRGVAVVLFPTGGTAKVQYTISGEEDLEAGNALWFDWRFGDVSAVQGDGLYLPVTAIRAVGVTGGADLEIRA